MPREVADYIALALIADFGAEKGYFSSRSEFSGDLEQLRERAEEMLEFPISEATMKQVVRTLADCGLIRITDDNFSGTFVKIRSKGLDAFIESAQEETARAKADGDELGIIERPSDYPSAAALLKHEIFEDYHEFGSAWLTRAIEGLRRTVAETGSLHSPQVSTIGEIETAPASDRIVTFSDNQISELDAQTSEVIEAVSGQNQIDDNPGLRELVIGQLKAGRELIRAGSFRVYFLQLTLIETLQFLAKRYEKEAIGALAASLIAALLKHIGIDS